MDKLEDFKWKHFQPDIINNGVEGDHMPMKRLIAPGLGFWSFNTACGHLHTKNGDGSVLSTLGWSPNFAFHYTWLPRHVITE